MARPILLRSTYHDLKILARACSVLSVHQMKANKQLLKFKFSTFALFVFLLVTF